MLCFTAPATPERVALLLARPLTAFPTSPKNPRLLNIGAARENGRIARIVNEETCMTVCESGG